MKKDLSDLKAMFFDMVEDNNLRMPDIRTSPPNSNPSFLPSPSTNFGERRSSFSNFENYEDNQEEDYQDSDEYNQFRPSPNSLRPIIIGHKEKANYNEIEEVEENLSLKDMERDLIEKALKKHKGKRKDAAAELGISERTLYRKIQQYEIEE